MNNKISLYKVKADELMTQAEIYKTRATGGLTKHAADCGRTVSRSKGEASGSKGKLQAFPEF